MGVMLFKWCLPAIMTAMHPFYMSVTEIRYNSPRKSLEISCRIFSDDLENVLKKESKQPLDIIHPKNRPAADSLVAQYLRRHLFLSADGKPLSLKYLGYEISEDATWCYLECTPMAPFRKLDIKNDILYAEHATQSHMVHAIVNDRRQSTKLDNPSSNATFSF
ncbi:DUF6702 family protein [Chitinophaga rhizosphaerae]|uniref:DUF6702 family protein n=1 Tax=Chitinophaga rhizosphaerae TaxID=1864947 RepID=UPI000F807D0E|nr:DUF6702 family protein [Chitinophaga rhizosphaerae]